MFRSRCAFGYGKCLLLIRNSRSDDFTGSQNRPVVKVPTARTSMDRFKGIHGEVQRLSLAMHPACIRPKVQRRTGSCIHSKIISKEYYCVQLHQARINSRSCAAEYCHDRGLSGHFGDLFPGCHIPFGNPTSSLLFSPARRDLLSWRANGSGHWRSRHNVSIASRHAPDVSHVGHLNDH